MPDLTPDQQRELATGAALATAMARQDRREEREHKLREKTMSTGAVWLTVGLVVFLSVGTLALVMALAK